MAIHTSIDPRTLTQAADDTRQLTQPIHIAIRRRIHTHPPLLDQLRNATTPGATTKGPERRHHPTSRPPANLDTIQALTTIYVDLAGWHARLNLPSPPPDTDWQKTVMRACVGRLPDLAPAIADWLAVEIHQWWRLAATHTGWTTSDLQRLR